jgi:hypothetical protein
MLLVLLVVLVLLVGVADYLLLRRLSAPVGERGSTS